MIYKSTIRNSGTLLIIISHAFSVKFSIKSQRKPATDSKIEGSYEAMWLQWRIVIDKNSRVNQRQIWR